MGNMKRSCINSCQGPTKADHLLYIQTYVFVHVGLHNANYYEKDDEPSRRSFPQNPD